MYTLESPGPVEVDGKDEYFIDHIIDHKRIGQTYKYLVHQWKGETAGGDRWITKKYLLKTEALENYWEGWPGEEHLEIN